MPPMMMEDFYTAFPFAAELDEQQYRALLDASRVRLVSAGERIVENDQECPGLALIVSGSVRVSKASPDGREVTLYRLGAGATCTLSAACILGAGFGRYPVEVTAEQDCRIMMVATAFVRRSATDCEPLWRFIFTSMADRLYETFNALEKVAFQPLPVRLARVLLEFSGQGRHAVYSTHDRLAKELGTAREVISRQLKSLEQQNVLRLGRGRIHLLDVKALNTLLRLQEGE